MDSKPVSCFFQRQEEKERRIKERAERMVILSSSSKSAFLPNPVHVYILQHANEGVFCPF
jgi:hypothetical protein